MKKFIITLIVTILLLLFTYFIANSYANRIAKIENGEMIQISESYRDR